MYRQDGFPADAGAAEHGGLAVEVVPDPETPAVLVGDPSPGEFLGSVSGSAIQSALPGEFSAADDDEERSEAADRSQEIYALSRDPETYYEILVKSDVDIGQYEAETPAPVWRLMEEEADELAEELDGRPVVLLSSTFEGGGVAMQIPPEINFLRQKGIAVHWLVARPEDAAFEVTKKMHNLQQDVVGPEADFTEEDAAKHVAFGMDNFEGMKEKIEYFGDAGIYVFHDPQLVGMLPALKELNPNARFIFRNHINTDRDKIAVEGSPQNKIYRHIHETCGVDMVDTYIAHPVEQFVPYGTPNVAYQPPVSDEFEELNVELSEARIAEKLDGVDRQIDRQNRERQELNRALLGDEYAHVDDQDPLDRSRAWITGFARFDWAKAQHLNMELQKRVTDLMVEIGAPEELIPDTLITGNGATDDLDRKVVLNRMLELRRTKYAAYQDHIKVFGVEHDYEVVSALESSSRYGANFSIAEGWEHRRAEFMLKGIPSLSSDAGGLPMQGEDGKGGLVANLEDLDAELDRIAAEVVADQLDPDRYEARRQGTLEWAEEYIRPELTTVPNVIRELRIWNGHGDKTWEISKILAAENQRAAVLV